VFGSVTCKYDSDPDQANRQHQRRRYQGYVYSDWYSIAISLGQRLETCRSHQGAGVPILGGTERVSYFTCDCFCYIIPLQSDIFGLDRSPRCRYTWGTDLKHGFHGVYLGDLSRLQDIQAKRDTTNRNWQTVILYNIAKSLHEEASSTEGDEIDTSATCGDAVFPKDLDRRFVYETRQLWWKLHEKMQTTEYANMLLLVRMKDELEERCFVNKQRHITFGAYENIVNKLHVDTEGHVVEPFVEIAERHDREERQRIYNESMAQDMEEEYATK
jgi:hypothetical protein